MLKSFEEWYTDTFGGRITKEQASDAERIAYDYYVDNCFLTEEDVKNQKAKEEVKMTETIRTDNSETLKNALLNIKALEEQVEKMKQDVEWHYVKDGDYPKDNKPVICILGDVDSDNYEVGYYDEGESDEHWHFEAYYLPDDDGDNAWGVSAWQKINPPKLK